MGAGWCRKTWLVGQGKVIEEGLVEFRRREGTWKLREAGRGTADR